MGDKTLVMVKGPSCLGANLGVDDVSFEVSNFQPGFISFGKGSETLTGA